jgi:hypothetical protein
MNILIIPDSFLISMGKTRFSTGNELDDQGVGIRVPVGVRISISPCRLDWFWGPHSLLSNG